MKNPLRTKILFDGYYGFSNTGDDAFVEVAAWGAKNYWHSENFRFLGTNLPSTKLKVSGYPLPFKRGGIYQTKFLLLSNTRYFISAGGSTFHDISVRSNKHMALACKKANGDLKIGGIGVSLGPFKNRENERRVTEYLKLMDFLSLRDTASYELAQSLNLPYKPVDSFDLAALLPLIYQKNDNIISSSVKIIGISACNYESYLKNGDIGKETKRNKFLEDLIKYLDKNGNYQFNFIVFNDNKNVGDESLTMEIIRNSSPKRFKIVRYENKTEKMWNNISNCNLLISTRLHASIFACFSNVPFFLIEYHRKCADFLNDVGQYKEYRVFDAAVNIREIGDRMIDILEKELFKAPEHQNAMITKALKNFDTISLNL